MFYSELVFLLLSIKQIIRSYQSGKTSEIIVQTEKASKVNVQTYNTSLPFRQTSEGIVQKKCMSLLFIQNVTDYLSDHINLTKRPSSFIQKMPELIPEILFVQSVA